MDTRRSMSPGRQTGNFLQGLIVGVLLGLTLALGVALYIAKVPVPFVNKVPQRTAEQDAAEAEKNKNWDPNNSLSSKNPVKPPPGATASPSPASAPPVAVTPPLTIASAPRKDLKDPAAILADKPAVPEPSTKPVTDAFTYFVQAGAYGRMEDAEAQRARLGMMGMAARITEREQSGRTVFRVRLGPYDQKEEAARAKERLESVGVESALVQVQR